MLMREKNEGQSRSVFSRNIERPGSTRTHLRLTKRHTKSVFEIAETVANGDDGGLPAKFGSTRCEARGEIAVRAGEHRWMTRIT